MKKMWFVNLDVPARGSVFPNTYFPRKFYYKADALKCVAAVERIGGKASVKKEK
jgi:hypothetical protein